MAKRSKLQQKLVLQIAPIFVQRALGGLRKAPDEARPEQVALQDAMAARETALQIALWARTIVEVLESHTYADQQSAARQLQSRNLEDKIAYFKNQLIETQKGISYPNLPPEQRSAIEATIERKIQEFEAELARLQGPVRDLPQADPFLGRASRQRTDGQDAPGD